MKTIIVDQTEKRKTFNCRIMFCMTAHMFSSCLLQFKEVLQVIQRRVNGTVDFAREWNDYEIGFGNLTGEHWLGKSRGLVESFIRLRDGILAYFCGVSARLHNAIIFVPYFVMKLVNSKIGSSWACTERNN